MRISNRYKLYVLISSFILVSQVYAVDNLGRLFTTAQDRQELERIRQIQNKQEKVVEVREKQESVITKKEKVVRNSITLKGLVHRSDGKNSAWINDTNTFNGDFDSDLLQVPDNKIQSDQVTIIIPDDDAHIELRVGEVFVPDKKEENILEENIVNDNR